MRYSSDEFRQDWRYAVDQEFSTSKGQPFEYAPGGHQGWNDEVAKISLQNVSGGCISSDGSRMAVAVGKEVHIFDTKTQELMTVLRAHLAEVSGMAFQPNNADVLLTSSRQLSRRERGKEVVEAEAIIICWRLDEHTEPPTGGSELLASAIEAAAGAAAAKLAEAGTELLAAEIEELKERIAPSIRHIVTKHSAGGKAQIHGSLKTSFGSNVFSPSGRSMVYLPGRPPKSNDVDVWDMCICRTDDFATPILTLSGHTDSIMWMGWNQDESLFASVAWDASVRIWDAVTGEALHVFKTGEGCQNWTGAFSPDAKYFVATDGTTKVHVYDLSASKSATDSEVGEAYWVYVGEKERNGWRRTVSWHPNSKLLAVGKDQGDELVLLDVEAKTCIQRRTLSTAAAQVDREELRSMLKRQPGVSEVQFADAGNKIVVWTHGDDSIEVFDISKEQKWRFGRGGTEDVPGAEQWRDENGKVTSPMGTGMLVSERESKLWMASLDGDAIRFWAIDLD